MAYTNFYGFIDVEYIKQNSVLCSQMEDTFIEPWIQTAQEKWILPILSSGLYGDMQSEIELYLNSGTTMSTVYVDLLNNYVRNCLMHWVLYEMLPFANFKITNINVAKKKSEHSDATDINELSYLRNSIKATAQFYQDRLKKHICATHSTLYPLYNDSFSNTDGTYGQQNDKFFGFYINNF